MEKVEYKFRIIKNYSFEWWNYQEFLFHFLTKPFSNFLNIKRIRKLYCYKR